MQYRSNDRLLSVNFTLLEAFSFVANIKQWDEKTYEAYHGDIKTLHQFLMEKGIQPVLDNITEMVIRDFLSHMSREKAASTVRRYHGTINRVYKRLEREGIRNVMIDIELPPLQHNIGRYLTYEECVEILLFADELHEIEQKDIRLTARFMLYTGLRNETLQKCKVGYLDIPQGTLHIPPEISKRREPQILPLPEQLLSRTIEYIQTYDLNHDDPILPGLSGNPLHHRQLNRITDRMNVHFEWKHERKVTPHVFRATLSTLLDDMEVRGDVIDFILNHHPQTTREKHYSRSIVRKVREARLALDAFEAKIETMYHRHKIGVSHPTSAETKSPANPASTNTDGLTMNEVLIKALSGALESNPDIIVHLTQQLLLKER